MSDWKNVQYKDGKMRTSEGGGGGGSSTFAGLDDVSFNNIQNGQVPKYNSTTQKWENADESGGGGTVTDVTVDGTSVVNPQTGVAEIEMPTPPTIPVEDVEVNGTSVVNAQNVAEITSYKEVTLAEYQSLPSSKISDGVMYCIKDVGGADGFPPLIYSDEEREIGVWRDGKPLYQKTINVGHNYGSPSGNVRALDYSISSLNIDTIVAFSGTYLGGQALPYENQTVDWGCFLFVNKTTIQIRRGQEMAYSEDSIVTIQYTKTTDTAGSGTWTTQGGYAHHYSTDEKVIGTWIDGKPLYERVFNIQIVPSDLPSNYLSQYNVKSVKWGYIHTWAGNQEILSEKFVYNTNTKAFTSTEYAWSDFMYLQYTKTTD